MNILNGKTRDAAAAHWLWLKHALPWIVGFWAIVTTVIATGWVELPAKADDLAQMRKDHGEMEVRLRAVEDLDMLPGAALGIAEVRASAERIEQLEGAHFNSTTAQLDRIENQIQILIRHQLRGGGP